VRVPSRRPRRSSRRGSLALLLLLTLTLGACASAPPAPPLPPNVEAERLRLEDAWQSFGDLRTLAEIAIRQRGRSQRFNGALLLKRPASLRFEALSPFGPPLLVVAARPEQVTIWEVPAGRAYLLPSTPDANRRWLGLALPTEDLVALLAGHVRPLRAPRSGALLPADEVGPSVRLNGDEGTQRTWLDPAGRPLKVEWTEGKNPMRVTFTRPASDPATGGSVPRAIALVTLDGRLEVSVTYRDPAVETGFDPALMMLDVPQGVEIQDFR
jgi:outer membrane lipoprotein-sorting protein